MLDPNKLPHLQPQPAAGEAPAQKAPAGKTTPVFLSKKGILYALIAVVLLYFSLCLQGEHMLRQGLYRFFKDLGEEGMGVSYNAPSSYFALKSGINVDDLVITAPERLGGWVLNAGRITVSSTPFYPRHITVRTNGTHSLKTRTIGDIRLVVGQGDIEIHLPDKENPLSFRLNFKQVQTASPKSMEGFFISNLEITGRHALQTPKTTDEKQIRFSLYSDAVHLPAYISSHLPPLLQKFDLQGAVFYHPAEETASFLTRWINGSGTVEIEQSDIVWPPFSAQINGTFGLDDAFNPIGAGLMKAYGFFDLLDMLQNGDYLRSRRVSVAKVVLGEEIKKDAEQKDALTSTFSIQSGKIYTGPVLLYDRQER